MPPQAAEPAAKAPANPPPSVDPNLADEAAFREAYNEEENVTGDLQTAMVAKQTGVIRDLMTRKGYDEKRLKAPLDGFTRKQRLDFFQHLFDLPDTQQELPWEK